MIFMMLLTLLRLFFIFLVVPANTMYLTGFTNQQIMKMNFVFQDLDFCISNHRSSSISSSYRNHLVCIEKQMFHCLLRGMSDSERRFGLIYCGALSLNQHKVASSDILLFIEIIKGYILHYEVLKFNFEASPIISCGAHGLTVSYKGYRSMSFCGRRVPWTMIILSDKSYLHIMTHRYLQFEISIFYNSLQNRWINRFLHLKLLPLLGHKHTIFDNSGQYYVVTEPTNYIHLNIFSEIPVNGTIIVHDGPGRLSNIILKINNRDALGNVIARTSAFWAFVDIFTQYNIYIIIEIKKTSTTSKRQNNVCHNVSSETFKNVVCSEVFIGPKQEFLRFVLKNFVFEGPNQLTDTDTSPSLCQYGGLYVMRTRNSGDRIGYCEDIKDADIFSKYWVIHIILVWFNGYSRGYFSGTVEKFACETIYLERFPPTKMYKHEVPIQLLTVTYPLCYYVICPPLHVETQSICTIKLGPPSLGPTTVGILTLNTLRPCHTHLKNKFGLFEIKAKYTENWPLGLMNSTTTSISGELDNQTITFNYDFLHFAKVKLTLMCNEGSPKRQMALYVKTSTCQIRRGQYIYPIANNIPVLTNNCPMLTYELVAVKQQTETVNMPNYNYFIYKGDGHINTGHVILVEYKSCPEECRHFNYSVFVRSADNTDITEYTSHVGYTTFTGYYHRGFSVKINVPEKDCAKETCYLRLLISKPGHKIGIDNYTPPRFLLFFRNKG